MVRIHLKRRGVDHGTFEERPWTREEPRVLRGAVDPRLARRDIAASLALLKILRSGESLAPQLQLPRPFRVTGVSTNTEDVLEMEKVHVAAAGRELYIKVNWLSDFPGDGSMRLRFSFGTEVVDDWLDDPIAARASERLFDAVFPESRLVTRNRKLLSAIREWMGRAPRCVQRILYSNAPNGGALFHHDFVPRQLGVVYAQLAGSTAWLALPKRELARAIRRRQKWTPQRLLAYMDSPNPARIRRLVNHTPEFTKELAAEGWLFVLRPGDAVLMHSRSWDDVIWHSVFTVARTPNLALSFGLVAK